MNIKIKSVKSENILDVQVILRNLLNYELRNMNDFVRGQVETAIKKLDFVGKDIVEVTSPSSAMRGVLTEYETSGNYRMYVYFLHNSGAKFQNIKFLRKVTDIGLKEAKEYVESHGYILLKGNWQDVRASAFIAGGMGMPYNIELDVPDEDDMPF